MLKGLVSLVTGGASGLGRETAKHLAKQGGRVMVLDLPESKGQEVVDSLEGDIVFAPCDVRNEDDVASALALCKEKYGRLDVAVNCAGMCRAFKVSNPISGNSITLEDIEVVYSSHVYGTFNVSRLGAQLMAQNEPRKEDGQRGVLIFTSSVSADDGAIGQSAYSAATAAITAMTLPMARDLSSLGIRAVTISPGLIETPLTSATCLTDRVKYYLTLQHLFPRRFGYPSEYSHLVETIITNPMLNGENIKLSAGLRFHVHVRTPSENHKPRPPLAEKLRPPAPSNEGSRQVAPSGEDSRQEAPSEKAV